MTCKHTVYMYACMHTYMHACRHVLVHTYARAHTRTHTQTLHAYNISSLLICIHYIPLKVSSEVNPGYVVCECTHMTMFAGNFLVAPNKVELFKLELFLELFHNPIVVSVLIAFWCLYIIITVWARRKDMKDFPKVNTTVNDVRYSEQNSLFCGRYYRIHHLLVQPMNVYIICFPRCLVQF